MAKMTNAQLLAENATLRDACARLEAQLEALKAEHSAPRTSVAKPIDPAFSELARRCGINVPRASSPSHSVPRARREVGDVISTYSKADGTKWQKIVTGYNQCVHRQVL